MKPDAIKLVKGPLNFHYVKSTKSKVFLPIELQDDIYNKISPHIERLEFASKEASRPMLFVPKGNSTLMNFGPYTTVIRNDSLSEKVAQQMYEHINKVFDKSPEKLGKNVNIVK